MFTDRGRADLSSSGSGPRRSSYGRKPNHYAIVKRPARQRAVAGKSDTPRRHDWMLRSLRARSGDHVRTFHFHRSSAGCRCTPLPACSTPASSTGDIDLLLAERRVVRKHVRAGMGLPADGERRHRVPSQPRARHQGGPGRRDRAYGSRSSGAWGTRHEDAESGIEGGLDGGVDLTPYGSADRERAVDPAGALASAALREATRAALQLVDDCLCPTMPIPEEHRDDATQSLWARPSHRHVRARVGFIAPTVGVWRVPHYRAGNTLVALL